MFSAGVEVHGPSVAGTTVKVGKVKGTILRVDPEGIYIKLPMDQAETEELIKSYDRDLTNPIAIRVEVLYTQKGFKDEIDGLTFKLNLNYIEVPLLAKIMLNRTPERRAFPYLIIGPSFAFQVGCSQSAELGGSSTTIGCTDPTIPPEIRITTSSMDLGVALGAGIDILAGEIGKVTLDLRYTTSLTSAIESVGFDPSISITNQTISLMAGYMLIIGESE